MSRPRRSALIALAITFFSAAPLAQGAQSPNQSELRRLNDEVSQLLKAGQLLEASQSAERAVAVTETVFGKESPETATALGNLALLYKNQGRYASAEPLYTRALARDFEDPATRPPS